MKWSLFTQAAFLRDAVHLLLVDGHVILEVRCPLMMDNGGRTRCALRHLVPQMVFRVTWLGNSHKKFELKRRKTFEDKTLQNEGE